MCGKFTLTKDGVKLMDYLEIDNWDSDLIWNPNYNIAPSMETPIVTFKKQRFIQSMEFEAAEAFQF